MKKLILLPCLFLFAQNLVFAQVSNSSYVASNGEKILQLSITLPISISEAWNLFTVDSQLVKWIAPKAHIEFRTGGYIVTNYDINKSLDDTGSIRLDILSLLEKELLILKVKLNNFFPQKARAEDQHLQEIIQFFERSPGKTTIVSSMTGWGKGPDWDKVYDFFVKGNTWTYAELLKLYK